MQDFGEGMKMKGSGGSSFRRTGLHAQEHVIAERKRREKLNERFIALSATIPGLAKVLQINSFCVKFLKDQYPFFFPSSLCIFIGVFIFLV